MLQARICLLLLTSLVLSLKFRVTSFGFAGWTDPVQRVYSVGANITF